MTPRKARPFDRIPFRKKGYGTKAAADILSARGLPTTPWKLRREANAGKIVCHRPTGPRRFCAADLEQYLWQNIDKLGGEQ